jgi:hypothetical protein
MVLGDRLRVDLIGRTQQQPGDNLFYTCVQSMQMFGWSLGQPMGCRLIFLDSFSVNRVPNLTESETPDGVAIVPSVDPECGGRDEDVEGEEEEEEEEEEEQDEEGGAALLETLRNVRVDPRNVGALNQLLAAMGLPLLPQPAPESRE